MRRGRRPSSQRRIETAAITLSLSDPLTQTSGLLVQTLRRSVLRLEWRR